MEETPWLEAAASGAVKQEGPKEECKGSQEAHERPVPPGGGRGVGEGQVGDSDMQGRDGSEGRDQEEAGVEDSVARCSASSGDPCGRKKATAPRGTREGAGRTDSETPWSIVTLGGRLTASVCALQPTLTFSRPVQFRVCQYL